MSTIAFNTANISANERFEYWIEVVCRHCISADSNSLSDTFNGELQVNNLGSLDFCKISSTEHHWVRTPKQLRTDPDDDLWLGFTQYGHGELKQADRAAKLTPGSLFLYDASQSFNFSLGGDNTLIRIPRHVLSSRVRGVENLTASLLDTNKPGVLSLKMLLSQISTDINGLNAESSLRISQAVIELIVLSLEMQDVRDTQLSDDLYARVIAYIQRNLRNPEINLETIADAHNVSTRTITRAFARHDKTPMSELWSQRLIETKNGLESGAYKSVSQAALEYGFSDFSHFSRSFRKAFGVTPQQILRVKNGHLLEA